MSAERPINADVEVPGDAPEPAVEPKTAEARRAARPPEESKGPPREERPEPPRPRRRRPGVPGPIKLVAVLVAIAIGFIVLAVVAGSGSKKDGGSAAPTPSTTAGAAPAESGSTGGAASEAETEASGAATEELGYPSFATSNTTRIGGPDPVSNAAATALAVFPATDEKQRPVAVALVGKEDWAGAIAAAVLMAEPVKAPLLYGEPEGVPDPTSEALAALRPRGGAASGGSAVFAIGDVQVPGGTSATKV
ncbi:MAG TPA: hypothetical protein VHE08_00885, partial [Solirubrobacterales bacterium]|nr:hypothetical protein [Solirubrobacterales bacterium]